MGYLCASIVIAPFAAPFSMPLSEAPLVLAHGGFVLTASVLLAIGPRFITSAEVGLIVLLESVLAPILAWAVVGESPGGYALLGGAIVVGALTLSNIVLLRRMR